MFQRVRGLVEVVVGEGDEGLQFSHERKVVSFLSQ